MIYDAIEQPKNQPEFHSDRHQRGRNWASLKTALQSTATEEKCNECFFEQAYDNEVGSPAWLKVARVRVALPFLFVISIFGPLPFGAILDGLADNRDIALEKHDEGRVAAAGN